MAAAPIQIKLRCSSWQQLSAIYKRDLTRSAVFLKSSNPPPIGTAVQVNLTLPTESLVVLNGTVKAHVPEGGLGGRGPGIDIAIHTIPQSAMWLIESALAAKREEPSQVSQVTPPPMPPSGPLPSTTTAGASVARAIPAPPAPSDEVNLEDGEPLVAAEADLVRALSAEFESLAKLNPFQVLGVGYGASDDEVRASFGELTKRYHPDRYARYQSGEARNIAAEIFILIRDAYRRLGDPKSRALARASIEQKRAPTVVGIATPPPQRSAPTAAASPTGPTLPPLPRPPPRSGGGPAMPPGAPPAIPAPRPVAVPPRTLTSVRPPMAPPSSHGPGNDDDPASEFIDLGSLEGLPVQSAAEPRLTAPTTAMAVPRGAGDYGNVDSLLDAGKYDEALAVFKINAKRNPSDRHARAGIELAEGLKAMAQRDRLEAAQRFEVVLELDPGNERAARELAEMRRQATNERKGLLSRLLGKKD